MLIIANLVVLANVLVLDAGLGLPLAPPVFAFVSIGALEVMAALGLFHANVVLTKFSWTAVTITVAAKPGYALVVGADLAGKTFRILATLVKGLLLAVTKGIAELFLLALAVRATNRSNWALLAHSVKIADLVQLALRINFASEMVTATTPAFRVANFAIMALSVVLAFVVLLGLAETVVAEFTDLALVVGLALGTFSLLTDSLGVAKVALVTAFIAGANRSVDCLADSPVGADLAPFAV